MSEWREFRAGVEVPFGSVVTVRLGDGREIGPYPAIVLDWAARGASRITHYRVEEAATATDMGYAPGNTDAKGEGKQTNPKDVIGATKLDVGLVPDIVDIAAAQAYTEGALKYGRFNWRIAGVRASIYHAAMRRHLARWWNGEDCDPVTGVPHLASMIACSGILLDAELCKKLNDDRPPRAPVCFAIDLGNNRLAHLRELFKEHSPKQFTIADSEVPHG